MASQTKSGTGNDENLFIQEGLNENLFVRDGRFGKNIESSLGKEEFDTGIGKDFCKCVTAAMIDIDINASIDCRLDDFLSDCRGIDIAEGSLFLCLMRCGL